MSRLHYYILFILERLTINFFVHTIFVSLISVSLTAK